MKILAGILIIITLVFLGYQWGINSQKARQAIAVTRVQDQAAKELNRKTEALNDISYRFHETAAKQAGAIQKLQEQLRSRPAVKNCVAQPGGGFVAFIDDGHIRMLDAAARGESGLSAEDRSGLAGKTGAVTADQHVQYTAYAIGQYNECAGQLNALIDSVKVTRKPKQ